MTTNQSLFCIRLFNLNCNKIKYIKMTARSDKVAVKSQSKPDFAGRKYGHWRKTASREKSKVRALNLPLSTKYP